MFCGRGGWGGGLSTVPLGGSKSHFTLPLEWRIYATESFFLSLNFSTSIFISIELAHEVLLCLLIKHLYVYYYFKSQFCVIFLWFFVNDFYLLIRNLSHLFVLHITCNDRAIFGLYAQLPMITCTCTGILLLLCKHV